MASTPHPLNSRRTRSASRPAVATRRARGDNAVTSSSSSSTSSSRRNSPAPSAARTALSMWTDAAWALTSDHYELRVPLETLLEEAQTAVGFFERHWPTRHDPRTGRLVPGLCSATVARLPHSTGCEIVALREAVRAAQRDYMLAIDPCAHSDLLSEAREVLCELAFGLEWLMDELAGTEHRVAVETLLAREATVGDTPHALADALRSYASIAGMYEKNLLHLPEFPPGLVAHARGLERTLRELAEGTEATGGSSALEGPARALSLRNRLLILLVERVERVRRAARLVFRNHPGIYRQIASLVERPGCAHPHGALTARRSQRPH